MKRALLVALMMAVGLLSAVALAAGPYFGAYYDSLGDFTVETGLDLGYVSFGAVIHDLHLQTPSLVLNVGVGGRWQYLDLAIGSDFIFWPFDAYPLVYGLDQILVYVDGTLHFGEILEGLWVIDVEGGANFLINIDGGYSYGWSVGIYIEAPLFVARPAPVSEEL